MKTSGPRVEYANVTLRLLVSIAYDVADSRLLGGPEWTDTQCFDVAALAPAEATKGDIPQMLQKLLAQRLKLVVQHQSKVMPAYSLVVAKNGPKLKKTGAEGEGGGNMMVRGRLMGPNYSMRMLAEMLTRQTGRPVLDRTNLEGTFQVDLKWAPDSAETSEAPSGPSLYTALQEQLGLKLENAKAPVDFLMIQSAERVPTEN